MPETEVYLDNSATTKPCEEAMAAMAAAMERGYYNPSALYRQAVEAERAIGKARAAVAAPVEANADGVLFTSGGTESDNLAIQGCLLAARGSGAVLYSAAEHPAVKNACVEAAKRYGHTAVEIPLTARGVVDTDALRVLLSPEVKLICVMQVSNETGAVMPLEEVIALRDELAPKAAIHVDGVQGYLRVPFSMKRLNVQSYAVSAHKVHGPKGVGALMLQKGYRIQPLLLGGGQQGNLRSGTENTPGITAFAAAVDSFPRVTEAQKRLFRLKKQMTEDLSAAIPLFQAFGPALLDADAALHILYAAFPPVRAETMVHALETVGVLAGTGSACSSHGKHISATLQAMGVKPELMQSAVRFSFSVYNTPEEIAYAVEQIIKQYQLLARFTRR